MKNIISEKKSGKKEIVKKLGKYKIFSLVENTEIMEKSNQEPRVIDYNSDSDEFSDAIDTHEEIKGDDDFFDVPEWRETKAEKQEDRLSEKDESETEASIQDFKEQKLKERIESEAKLSDEEISEKKKEALDLKKTGNELYLAGENIEAVKNYDQALDICPLSFKEDRAILLSNKAAASLKMGQKEKAIEDCTEALELNPNYVKALLRRAQTYEDTDKPHEAMKDFEKILELDPGNKDARMAVLRLPEKIREKDEKLKAEMMDGLKKLGNMCLKPFGLSTNNFDMVQDPNTGGYNIQFNK